MNKSKQTKSMKRFLTIASLVIITAASSQVYAQNGVGINSTGAAADPSAALDVASTNKGVLLPRMTAAEKVAIASPANGLLIFQTDGVTGFWYYNATTSAWVQAVGPQGPAGATGSVGSVTAISGTSNANGATIDNGGNLTLTPADATNGGIVTNGVQTFAGNKTFLSDLKINNLTIGQGGGNIGNNTVVGGSAMLQNSTGIQNVAMGFDALRLNTTGSQNAALGAYSLKTNTTGTYNTAIGHFADVSSGNLTNATAIGNGATVNASNKIQLGNTSVTSVNTSATYTGAGFVKTGGTSSQYLMADGTVSTGATGPQGPAGPTGATGPQGPIGLTGATGAAGTNGTNGAVGATGPQGPIGLTGATGPQGTQGIQGLPGATGGYPVHTIGESYGGGIVFYVYDGGQHGLIAATADQSTAIRWYGGTNTNTRARGDGIGAGLKNTAIIIANQGSVDGAAFAATVCNEYSVTVGGITYGDWYLPSKYELHLLYLQKNVVGGFAINYYWSSSEYDYSIAWLKSFNSGFLTNLYKNYQGGVRAVRAF